MSRVSQRSRAKIFKQFEKAIALSRCSRLFRSDEDLLPVERQCVRVNDDRADMGPVEGRSDGTNL